MGDKLVGMKNIAADLGISENKFWKIRKKFQSIDPAPISVERVAWGMRMVAWTYPEWIRPWYFRVCQKSRKR